MITYCPHYKDAIELFYKYFINRFDILPVYLSSRITTIKATDKVLQSHLLGTKPSVIEKGRIYLNNKASIKCGAYCPDTNSRTKYACIDFDGNGHSSPLENPQDAVIKTYLYARSLSIPCYIECSASGTGYHLWIFFEKTIQAIHARALCRCIIPDSLRLAKGEPVNLDNNKGIEIFPKTNELTKGKFGNQVWLPWYYGASEKGSIFYEYKDTLEPMVPTKFNVISESEVIDIVNKFGGLEKIFKGKNLSYSVNLDKTNDVWKIWRESVLTNLDLTTIYGPYLTGSSNGEWLECRDPWSESGDVSPSAGVASGVPGGVEKGTWHSFISAESLSVFDFIRKLGITENNHMAACRYMADITGTDLPRSNNDNLVPVQTIIATATPVTNDIPQIIAANRQFRDIVEDCWVSIQNYNNISPRVFTKSGHLVKINEMEEPPCLKLLNEAEIYGLLGRSANWIKITNSGFINVLPLDKAARDMLVSDHEIKHRLPKMEAVVTTPIFSKDKELVVKPGYHSGAKVWYKPSLTVSEIPKTPSESDIQSSKNILREELLVDFPFCTEGDIAHAYAALLLPFIRQLIDGPTPLHIVEAPGPGTGKGKLCNLISILTTGTACESRSLPGTDDEIRKMITAELIKSKPLILLDNASEKKKLDSPSLASVLTSTAWTDRFLGESTMITVSNLALWMLTANNPKFSMEIARRCVRIRLDAKIDQPWKRKEFKHNYIEEWAKDNRGLLVRAILILVQNWIVKGSPQATTKLGSFERWSAIIGGILEVNEIKGFLCNLDEIYEHSDKEGIAWRHFVSKWYLLYQDREVSLQELFRLCDGQGLMGDVIGEGSERTKCSKLAEALSIARDRVILEYTLVELSNGSYSLRSPNGASKIENKPEKKAPPKGRVKAVVEDPANPHLIGRKVKFNYSETDIIDNFEKELFEQ